mgnify:CR=1 FL=1
MLKLLFAIFISASLDSTTILIGDQTNLHLSVSYTENEIVQMPIYDEWLIPGVEIVRRSGVDTTFDKSGRTILHQDLLLTSFIDTLFYIPPIAFTSGNDTTYSEALTLNVIQPFEMDTTLAITDIKAIQKAPVWFWGIIRWILLGLLLIAAGIGIYFLIRRLRQRNTDAVEIIDPELLRPAEEVALEKLEKIKEEKIWQSGQTKEYHTELTAVVREYIGRRFDVQSTEKTSDETLRELQPKMKEQRDLFCSLQSMLRLADLVKFAKWTTTPDENEQSLRTAYDFVHNTTASATEEPTLNSTL